MAAATTLRGSWRSKTASELREIGDKSLILSPILVFEHELNEYAQISVPMDAERRSVHERQGQGVLMLCLWRWLNDGLQVGRV